MKEDPVVRSRMRVSPMVAVFLLLAGCAPTPPDLTGVFDGTAGEWVDLTHSFDASTIYWPTDTAGFQLDELAYGRTEGGWFYASYAFATAEHGGTHLDAPVHFAEGRRTADQIPLADLIGPAAVVDVSDRAGPDYQVSAEDLQGWEAAHGPLPDGSVLLLRTGWGDRWDDRTAYLGTDLTGPAAVPELHFPGLSPGAAEWLVQNRNVAAVGIDTPSIDYGQSTDFRSHVLLYSADLAGFENVANLDRLPESGAFVVALPMKIAGGSGGPLRIVAFVPGDG
jgi:kynurenine formamidase